MNYSETEQLIAFSEGKVFCKKRIIIIDLAYVACVANNNNREGAINSVVRLLSLM